MVEPANIELQPNGIHIEWDDGHSSDYPHRQLRGECRCAACVNELSGRRMVGYDDVPEGVQALDWMTIGRYALQFLWSDAHDTGIYPYTVLRHEICFCNECTAKHAAD